MSRLLARLSTALAALAFALFTFVAPAMAAVDVNNADQSQLESVKGIGPALSGRILTARKTGAFKDWSDLQTRVSGIGDRNSVAFSRNGLTVSGRSKDGADATAGGARASRPVSKKGAGDVVPTTIASSAKK